MFSWFSLAPLDVDQTTMVSHGNSSRAKWTLMRFDEDHVFLLQNAKIDVPLKIFKKDDPTEITVRFFLKDTTKLDGRGRASQRWYSLWVTTASALQDNLGLQIQTQVVINDTLKDELSTTVTLTPDVTSVELISQLVLVANWNVRNNNWDSIGLPKSLQLKLIIKHCYIYDFFEKGDGK